MTTLIQYLETKTLFYDKIELKYIREAYTRLKHFINKPFVIHIVGTNGKGSTGRFLAHYLSKIGKSVLHYSSPHILRFNERIWIDGKDIDDSTLNLYHYKLYQILGAKLSDRLTYFEYTTLIAILASSNKDYLILEAGLGGEFDATNVIKNDLTLVTTIGLDHQEFLGNTIPKIAKTKLRSSDNLMIVGKQNSKKVFKIAKKLKPNSIKYHKHKIDLDMPKYLKSNLSLALCAIEYLGFRADMKLFDDIKIFGRAYKFRSNITLDVGHNHLSAKAIKKLYHNNKICLIYNSYKDKDYKKILKTLKPIIKKLLIIQIDDKRIVNIAKLKYFLDKLNISYDIYNHKIDETKEYLVYGSFKVVEEFINGQK